MNSSMRWLRNQPLKIRLTLWHAAISSLILIILTVFVFEEVEHRLRAEIDKQLRNDFDFVVAELEERKEELREGRLLSAQGEKDYHKPAAWFEVWSLSGDRLLHQWPSHETVPWFILEPPKFQGARFWTMKVKKDFYLRIMEHPARIAGKAVVIRVFGDISSIHHTLGEIAVVLSIAAPMAVLLAALGGFFIAGRSLAPVGEMAGQARMITAESLNERLPVNNPNDELGQLAQVFNNSIERLDASFAELKRFTADASHELRTPLTALRSVGEVGLRGPDDSEALRETISSMLEEAQHLNDLIDSLLLLCRADSGETKPNLQSVELGGVLKRIVSNLEILAQEKQQSFKVEITKSITVQADPVLLHHAVMNILHNAIRYSRVGSVIQVRITQSPPGAGIEIEDKGPGISKEHQEKIFERFYRVDKARSRSEGGSGLGLAIAKWSVEQQGGKIELRSEPGKGSLFRIFFPDQT